MSIESPDNVTASPPFAEDVAGVPQEVASGIWRIPLPLPFALRWVNAYVLAGEGEWCLVDCGLGTKTSNAALVAGIAALGISFADLTALVLTHAHPDHIGPAGDIVSAMSDDARVHMLGLEATRMALIWGVQTPDDLRATRELWARSGLSQAESDTGVQELLELARLIHLPPPSAIAALTDDATVRLAGRDWRVLWTPGHADGHICLVNEQIVLAGDHILPKISSNVSFYPNSRPDPMQDYFDGLGRLAALDLTAPLVLPGHGAPFTHLAERIATLRDGHARRSQATLAALRTLGQPVPALDVTRALFGDRLRTSIDARLALGETLAHLEHLRIAGQVMARPDGSLIRYALTEQ